jgi:hypothetical protein
VIYRLGRCRSQPVFFRRFQRLHQVDDFGRFGDRTRRCRQSLCLSVDQLAQRFAVRRAVEPDALHQAGVLAPQLAELIVSHGDEKILESHRREIVVVFCRVTRLLQVSRAERVRFHMPDCPGKRRASRAADRSPDTLRWLYDFDPAAVPSAP